MKLLHLKRRFYEARLTAYEAALRAMKQSLFRLHSPFLPQAKMVEVRGILRKPSLKLKTVANNTILLNRFTSSENISKRIKFKTENLFYLKVNVRYSDRNELFTPKIVAPQTFVYFRNITHHYNVVKQRFCRFYDFFDG